MLINLYEYELKTDMDKDIKDNTYNICYNIKMQ